MKTNLLLVGRSATAFFLTIGMVFGFTIASFATTYYVSPLGSDATGNGTLANPWKTLKKATNTVTGAGNIIHLVAGTYTETQTCTLAVGVSIEGEGRTTTIVNSTLTGTWSVFLELYSPDGTNGAQSISGLTIDGGYISSANVKTWVGIWVTGRSNVLVHDCTLRNWKQSSTIFNGNGTNTNPGTDVGQPVATGNKFYNNIVTNSSAMYNGTGQGALMIGFQTGMEIYGNNIQQIERPNFENGWPIKYWNQGWLKGVKIYNNTLTKIPYSGSYPGENGNWDFALEFFNIEGLEIYGNTIQGAIDMAYSYRGSYAYCAWIHDNTLSHPVQGTKVEGAVIFEYRAEGAIVENNVINNKTYGVTFNTRGYAQNGDDRYYLPTPPVGGYSYVLDCKIRNNLFSNMYYGTGIGNRFAIGVISDGPEDPQINNMQIYNNTITAKAGDAPYIAMDFTSQVNGNCNGLYIRNNIITGFTSTWLQGSAGATNVTNCTVTHNDAYNNGSNAPIWPAGNPVSYTYSNNKTQNPLFVSTTNFNLQPTSPMIDVGVYVGTPFVGTAPDPGYKEFGAGSLPITLIDFTARENGGKNILNWNTANEINSAFFSIERSTDGKYFTMIGRVNASGYSSAEIKYSFTDVSPVDGRNFYRLVMTDLDGTYEYSKVVSVTNRKNQSIGFGYINMPAGSNSINITVSSTKAQSANLVIVDATGRTILTSPVQLQQGTATVNKNIPLPAAGVYYIRLFTAEENIVKSIVSQ